MTMKNITLILFLTVILLNSICFSQEGLKENDFKERYKDAIGLIRTNPALARENLEILIKDNGEKELILLSNIATCYLIENNPDKARETYEQIYLKSNAVSQNDYKFFVQAASYLFFYSKNSEASGDSAYIDKIEDVSNGMINKYPDSKVSEEANCVISYCEILKGNIIEAKKRAAMAKNGHYCILAGYVYSGISDEFNKDYSAAKNEYQNALKIFPKSRTLITYLKNLDDDKNNLSYISPEVAFQIKI